MKPIPVLEVMDLAIGFPSGPAVHGVSFEIHKGEMMALVGESGCGKSLTAFAIMRLLPPAASILNGQVIFEGADLASVSAFDLRRIRGNGISLILQEPMTSLNPVLTVGTQVAEVIRRHKKVSSRIARAQVIELFDLVGIPEPQKRYDQFPHNFSGGMRQRVMIAMAVACNPALLIADEPTTALDVTIQAQVMDLLDRLRRELSMAVLLITHDLGVVAQWADRVAVMYAGRVVETAPVARFFDAPQHPYSMGLLNSSVSNGEGAWHYTSHRLTEISGSVNSAAFATGCSFAPRCSRVLPACHARQPELSMFEEGWLASCRRGQVKVEGQVYDIA
jgi:peptide/nickel transport system ATP-binding protein